MLCVFVAMTRKCEMVSGSFGGVCVRGYQEHTQNKQGKYSRKNRFFLLLQASPKKSFPLSNGRMSFGSHEKE